MNNSIPWGKNSHQNWLCLGLMNVDMAAGAFQIGMNVLVVDDDRSFLDCLVSQLEECHYHVISETEAIATMKLLRNGKQNVDLVMIDANMLGMEGCKLFENVASFKIPFILLSSNFSKEFVMKGVGYGACDFITKPIRPYDLQNIWRHVAIRRNELKTKKLKTIESFQNPNKLPVVENINHSRKAYGKRKDHTNGEYDEKMKHQVLLKGKKRRVVWSQDLHHKFIAVVDKIGLQNAVPKKIMELMGDENLTRENVASHLQKYRLSLKKSSQKAKKPTSFGGSSNPTDGQNVNIQSISNDKPPSHSVPFGGFYSSGWCQTNTFMNINDNIYSSFQMDRPNTFSGLSTPSVEFDCINQPYVASTPLVSNFPSNMEDFNEFHHGWSEIQSPRVSLACPSNDSIDNMLTCASSHTDACYANENWLYDWNGHKTIVDHELLSNGSTFLVEDYNLIRGMKIDDDNSQIEVISNLKQQKKGDDYVTMQRR